MSKSTGFKKPYGSVNLSLAANFPTRDSAALVYLDTRTCPVTEETLRSSSGGWREGNILPEATDPRGSPTLWIWNPSQVWQEA